MPTSVGGKLPSCFKPCYAGSTLGQTGVKLVRTLKHGQKGGGVKGVNDPIKLGCQVYNTSNRGDLLVECNDGAVKVPAGASGCKPVVPCASLTLSTARPNPLALGGAHS